MKNNIIKKDKTKLNNSYELADMTIDILNHKEVDKERYTLLLEELNTADFLESLTTEEKIHEKVNMLEAAYAKRDAQDVFIRIKAKKRRSLFVRLATSTAVAAAALLISFLIHNPSNKNTTRYIAQKPINVEDYVVPVIVKTTTAEIVDVKEIELTTLDNSIATFIEEVDNKEFAHLQAEVHKVIVPACYTQKVVLSDGTEVTINSQSSLEYPKFFMGDKREVILQGEAYFKVSKSDKPFIVKVNDLDVKVYGTEFNINEFNNRVQTVLVSGSVGVSSRANKASGEVMMTPNTLFECEAGLKKTVLKDVSVDSYIGWFNNDFDYRTRPLSDLLRDISRWYGIEIVSTSEIDKMLISLYASKDSDIDTIFKILDISNNLIFINEGGGKYSIEHKAKK